MTPGASGSFDSSAGAPMSIRTFRTITSIRNVRVAASATEPFSKTAP